MGVHEYRVLVRIVLLEVANHGKALLVVLSVGPALAASVFLRTVASMHKTSQLAFSYNENCDSRFCPARRFFQKLLFMRCQWLTSPKNTRYLDVSTIRRPEGMMWPIVASIWMLPLAFLCRSREELFFWRRGYLRCPE